MTIVEMRVHMDCAGCETKIKKDLQKLDGVDDIDIDTAMQKVTVMGWADQKKVLKTVRKTARRAELWPYPYNPEYQNFNINGGSSRAGNQSPTTHFSLRPLHTTMRSMDTVAILAAISSQLILMSSMNNPLPCSVMKIHMLVQ